MMAASEAQQLVKSKEFRERKHITKYLNAMIGYGRAKLNGFDFDAQIAEYGDVWRVVITVQWKPLPYPPELLMDYGDPTRMSVVPQIVPTNTQAEEAS